MGPTLGRLQVKTAKRPLLVWVVDPINYSGMGYYDLSLIRSLRRRGVDAVLVGSDRPLVRSDDVPVLPMFVGTHPGRARWMRGVAHAVALLRVTLLALRTRPDVVHWQYLQIPVLDALAMFAMRVGRIPVVLTAHEAHPWTVARSARVVRHLVYALCSAVVVHNAETRAVLESAYRASAGKLRVIEHGDYREFADLGLDQGEARRRLSLPLDAPVALFFGSFRPTKGLDLLVGAWPHVIAASPDAWLVIAGSGASRDGRMLDHSVAGLGIAAHVRWVIGDIAPEDANFYYSAADVVVLPYREIGTSGVLRYAFSCARAVVATSVGEHERHVTVAQGGWVVRPIDVGGLATALAIALSDRARAAAMGKAAHEYSSSHFDWSIAGRETEELYKSLA